nr:immunoglobulin light chain junction region [Macaca mulatta]MOV95985.1 immunoglobulin light chain junction region [Macaca mulatta]
DYFCSTWDSSLTTRIF